MKKEEIKTKIKNFADEHEKGLKIAGGIGLVALGGLVGWKMHSHIRIGESVVVRNGHVNAVLKDAAEKHSNKMTVFTGFVESGESLKPEDLGDLKEVILETAKVKGLDASKGFTHYILLGERC